MEHLFSGLGLLSFRCLAWNPFPHPERRKNELTPSLNIKKETPLAALYRGTAEKNAVKRWITGQ